jgi:hypothetical protein
MKMTLYYRNVSVKKDKLDRGAVHYAQEDVPSPSKDRGTFLGIETVAHCRRTSSFVIVFFEPVKLP